MEFDGIRVEYFPGFTTLQSPRFHEQNGRPSTIPRDELSSCRCSMTSYGELQTMERNVLLTLHLCLHFQKDSQQDVGHSSDLGTESLNR